MVLVDMFELDFCLSAMVLWNDGHKSIKNKLFPSRIFITPHSSKEVHFLTNQMVKARSGPNNNKIQRGQQIPPPPPNPNMEQFIAAQMQLLQGLTASVQQIQQQQQNAPLARDKHRNFMSHHPPNFLSCG
jgi:hypothetical protein